MPAVHHHVHADVHGRRGTSRRNLLLSCAPVIALLAAASGHQSVAQAVAARGAQFSGDYTNSAGTRHYVGYVPSTYRAGTAVPLVVALHGCTETADTFRTLSRTDGLAEARKVIVVYPEQSAGSKGANYLGCWNWFNNSNMQRGSGEPSLIAGITQWVEQHYTVDPRRVYVMGFSAGGAMASIMGATYPDLYAAIGVGSGIEYGATGIKYVAGIGLDPTQAGQEAYHAMGPYAREMPALIFHGGQDTTVPVINAHDLVTQWQVTDQLAGGSVSASPSQTLNQRAPSGRSYTVSKYVDSHGQELLQSWLVPDMVHAWSGGCGCAQYADTSGPDETAAMFDFFGNHPMPASGATTSLGLPSFPGMPSFSGLPSFPGLPASSGLPSFPGLPAVPGLSTLPGLSILPGLSNLLGLLTLPGLR